VRLPRDLSGSDLVKLLERYGYQVSRQTGGHIRLTSVERGAEHHITIPSHRTLRVGTLSSIIAEVAAYLERTRDDLSEELFG
jgi:predicted RNA binding protein YcfA (HicA-like mRNA interferase family)